MKNPQTLMVQGTTSDAGKSVLVAAIGRILARKGLKPAPFKPQNMALNGAVTKEGGEIGRAQAVQARACFLEPSILMNPVLLKPSSDTGAEVIVHGKVIGHLNAINYHEKKTSLLPEVIQSFETLQQSHPIIIVEGAGSPAEINLRDRDIANMGFAEAVDCPVIIIADIDRGGVFAHLLGTYELLSKSEQQRIKGFVINRFRGDISLLEPGLKWLEERCNVPVLGVIPYIHDLYIEAEDAIDHKQLALHEEHIKVVVIGYPHAGNHTDMDPLRMHPNVSLEWLRDTKQFNGADMIILPGSTSVRDDLQWLKDNGWQEVLDKHLRYGGKLLAICGGFQVVGKTVADPYGLEGDAGISDALGYLAIDTVLEKERISRNVLGELCDSPAVIQGYEIHSGISHGTALARPFCKIHDVEKPDTPFYDGAISDDRQVIGTYVHGLFVHPETVDYFLQWVGLTPEKSFDYAAFTEQEIERLADVVEEAIPFVTWQKLLQLETD